MFIPMYTLTRGGPSNSTNIVMYEAFKNVFTYGDRGVGNAMVMVMLLMIFAVISFQFLFLRSKD
jgi:ABC-type sugar transport system permease subunit